MKDCVKNILFGCKLATAPRFRIALARFFLGGGVFGASF